MLGYASPEFALSLAMAGIVMYDAMGVRRAAGEAGEVLTRCHRFKEIFQMLKEEFDALARGEDAPEERGGPQRTRPQGNFFGAYAAGGALRRGAGDPDRRADPGILIKWGVPLAKYNLLNRLELPGGVKRLNPEQQKILCWEIRQKLLHTLSENGGHLASNLGVVELTVALHTVFDVPQDAIVWDVGHQCYAHKMLTGRLGAFSTIRREGGSPASRARARAAVTPLSRGTRAPRSPPPAGSRRPRRSRATGTTWSRWSGTARLPAG